jgi:hypothetical protein
MTPSPATPIRTGLVCAADLSLEELLVRRKDGDSALDHCLRRVVEDATSGERNSVAAFNAAPLRRS